jgi:hypothetical protein
MTGLHDHDHVHDLEAVRSTSMVVNGYPTDSSQKQERRS